MRVIDDTHPAAAPKPSMFLHGITGNGKSTWAATGGRPLVILTEPKAQSVLRQINPQAIGLVPESLDDLDQLMVVLGQTDRMAAKGIDRIILDSFTELTLAIPRWLKEKSGPVGTLVKLELSEFGHLRDYALAIVKAIQLTGYPSVIIGRSVSKRVGLVEQIRPDGTGRSVDELPGKLLPTAEARFDAETGRYVIDTTPADHSQRCGLPWVPQIWDGSCLDYLRVIEAGPQGQVIQPDKKVPAETTKPTTTAPATATRETATPAATVEQAPATRPAPAAATPQAQAGGTPPPADPEKEALLAEYGELLARKTKPVLTPAVIQGSLNTWRTQPVERIREAIAEVKKALGEEPQTPRQFDAPDPEKDPAGYQQAAGKMFTEMAEQKLAESHATPAVADEFVDRVAEGPGRATPEDITDLQDTCTQLKVNLDSLWLYAEVKGEARRGSDGSKNWYSLSAKFVGTVLPQLKDKDKQRALVAWLHQKYPALAKA